VERRLRDRGSEAEEKIRRRMEISEEGYSYIDRYTYIVVNDTLRGAAHQLQSILLSEQCKSRRMPKFFQEYRENEKGD
jgi:guanylate kinase